MRVFTVFAVRTLLFYTQSFFLVQRLLMHPRLQLTESLFFVFRLINNYPPKWRWLAVDIYQATKWHGKYPPLATVTEVNSCFSIIILKQ